jgi:hypothetical protein
VRMIVVVATLGILSGCGFYHWHKDGADDTAFRRDSADCQQQAPGKWEGCMGSKGWIYSSGW